jgi:predicted SPOUT superfamily RNA methylase MTH1
MVIPGRIARALAVFSVDEVVIYEDGPPRPHLHDAASAADFTTRKEYTGDTDPCHFLAHVFSYLETPPFMRKTLFPMHPNLRLAGLLPTLDMQSHPHMRDDVGWREGFTVAERPKGGKG